MNPDPDRRPNVLLLMVDQWPGWLLGCEGAPVLTPTLDQLARLGTRYTRAYSESPICIPARRTVMTGTAPRVHGDRIFKPAEPMPAGLPTIASCFRSAGWQAFAVGKLHVYPPRDRIGFDDVLLAEEGRPQLGAIDDYDLFLSDRGHAGEQFLHGMNNNDYLFRPWHLDESLHVTQWITREACRTIKRRDPTRPAFWHVSYTHPHPPLVPLASYLELYRDRPVPEPLDAAWAREPLPPALDSIRRHWGDANGDPQHLAAIRRAFMALCTHIDHQLRVLLGTLREEELLDDTIVLLTADHGDMLGDFGLWAKRTFLEGSARVPMILLDTRAGGRVAEGGIDARPVGLQDVMPTLLSMAGIPVPATATGVSMVGERRRERLYGECREDHNATRMMHDGRHKLIWYPWGNRVHLFDLDADPRELHDLAQSPDHALTRAALEAELIAELHGGDLDWVRDGRLVGTDALPPAPRADRALGGQRGLHQPPPPLSDPTKPVGAPG
jgi:arylsulfatase